MRLWLLLLTLAFAQERPRMVVVEVDLLVQPDLDEVPLLWLGVAPHETDGSWLLPGSAPKVLEASEPMAVAPSWSLVLPMVEGLRYFAVLDRNGSGGPDRGEAIGGPIDLGGGVKAKVVIDRRLGVDDGGTRSVRATVPIPVDGRRTSDGSAVAPEQVGEGVETALTVALSAELSFFSRGRFVVTGFDPGTPWVGGVLPEDAAFVWTSPHTTLSWPVTLTAPMPPGLDVVVGLDLDGDGDLGPGDLVGRPMPSYSGETAVNLDRTLPRVRPAPPPEHHDFRPR